MGTIPCRVDQNYFYHKWAGANLEGPCSTCGYTYTQIVAMRRKDEQKRKNRTVPSNFIPSAAGAAGANDSNSGSATMIQCLVVRCNKRGCRQRKEFTTSKTTPHSVAAKAGWKFEGPKGWVCPQCRFQFKGDDEGAEAATREPEQPRTSQKKPTARREYAQDIADRLAVSEANERAIFRAFSDYYKEQGKTGVDFVKKRAATYMRIARRKLNQTS